MRIRKSWSVLAIALFTVLVVPVVAVATDEGESQMSPEERAMMEKWQAYMTPGEPHQFLAKMVGTWEFTTKMWQQPGAEAETSTGTSTMKSIMDGRYVVEHLDSTFSGQSFKGMGITGYDNIKKVFQSIWIDNMGTGILTSEGTCDGDVCTYHGEAPDVLQGKWKKIRSVGRHLSDDEMVFEMYDTGPDGKEWMSFQITYERKK